MGWFGWFRRKPAVADASARQASGSGVGASGGRRRTRGIPYLLPYDVEELNRLDFQHYMLRATLRGNYAAPVHAPTSILDVGTGTGRWAREMATLFPDATVIGVDVNPPPVEGPLTSTTTATSDPTSGPTSAARDELHPTNFTFVPGNILEGLSFPDGSFDFVHQRALLAAIPHDRWSQVARELARLTRAGGWVESLEVTELQEGGPATSQLVAWLAAALARRGVQFAAGGQVADYLRQAGLIAVSTRSVRMPCGDAGGRIGRMLAADWFSLFEATSAVVFTLGLTTPDQYAQVSADARAELAAPRGRCYMPVYIAMGQRSR